MAERKDKKKRSSSNETTKKPEANLTIKKMGKRSSSFNCFRGKSRSKYSFQDENSIPPDNNESSSVHLQSATSLELKNQELTNTEHEELLSLRTDVEILRTEKNKQLINIETKTYKIQEVETELANVKADLDKECQIRQQLEARLNESKGAIEQLVNAHKEQIRYNNETMETKERQFLEEKQHLDSQITKLEEERKALEDEKQDALQSLNRLNSSPVYLNSTTYNSLPNGPDESQGKKTTNIRNDNSTALKTEVIRVHTSYLKQTETIAALKHELVNIKTELDKECQTLRQLATLFKDRENEIKQLQSKLQKRKHKNATLKRDLKSLTYYKETLDEQLLDEKKKYTDNLNEAKRQIQKLKGDTTKLEEEKQDALRSAMMSVKLRDNNPNIADLSDPFRPTKLGEQFSELYDNEWTDAFDALQEEFEERHAISILLDIVMDSYQFCDTELKCVWKFANEWFIEENAPTSQQLSKTLKDSRKHNINRRVSDIQKKYTRYLREMTANRKLTTLVETDPLKEYISTCVRLSLLMTANDPPVVIECPDWQTFRERPYPDEPCSRGTSAESKVNHDANDEQSALAGKTLSNNTDDAINNDENGHSGHNDFPQEKDGATYDTSNDTHKANMHDLAAVKDLPSEQKSSPMSDTTNIADVSGITTSFPNEDVGNEIQDNEKNYDQTPAVTVELSTTGDGEIGGTANRSSDNYPELEAKEDNAQVANNDPDDNINLQGNLGSEGKEKEQDNSSSSIAEQETNSVQIRQIFHENTSFDKDKFKEYTSRGPFVDYFVWPIMYLHRDGPMLGKGIAQGCKEKMVDVSREPFVWWNRLPASEI
ncbi:uncharacterized protein LOC127850596 isoform X2 [Dreissena polymorpha]|uniref:uncharacterized protein LOC127850596 isoform X2 n=1 Tax=Dreissena polymorpha TaxID=45954 RepID=UPI0022656C1E|nr:uncharacterized protein LOC127850596 isoform X2 [Dreissena polymorpha]